MEIGESFLAAVIGFAVGRCIFELIVWSVRKRRVKGTPDQDEGKESGEKG